MKINRAVLERIIDEELVRFLGRNLNEQAPGIGSPLDDVPPPEDETGGPPMPADGEVQDDGDDPADMALDDELAGEDPEVPGSVASDMQGKTIESISMDDESETIPGAKELVVSFQGEEDKLRVILTPSGNFKFFWKGLHSDIGSPEDVPPEEIEAEEESSEIEDDDELDTDSLALPTDDGGMDDPEIPEV
jgi:hypothetical protein